MSITVFQNRDDFVQILHNACLQIDCINQPFASFTFHYKVFPMVKFTPELFKKVS